MAETKIRGKTQIIEDSVTQVELDLTGHWEINDAILTTVHTLKHVPDPIEDLDCANKRYIDDLIASLFLPPTPGDLSGDLVSSIAGITGKIPSGLIADWYQEGIVPGDTLTLKIIYQPTLTLYSPDQTDSFGNGSQGSLLGEMRSGGGSIGTKATLDIEANHDGGVTGPDVQDLSTWDNTGTGDAVNDAIVIFNNAKGELEVTYCGWYNSVNAFQKMNAELNIANLVEGFYSFRMTHSLTAGDQSTNIYILWYDNTADNLSFGVSCSVTMGAIASSKYISGIRYYSLSDPLTVAYTADNVFQKCYHVSQVSKYKFDGRAADITKNPLAIPAYTDNLAILADPTTINRTNYYTTNGRCLATLQHPWKSSVTSQSPSDMIHICTYGNVSTDKIEYFRDENYRLPDSNYDTDFTMTGQWLSSATLSNTQALVYEESVMSAKPIHDFTASGLDILPVSTRDYSTFTGDQIYLRTFYDPVTEPHNNVNLTLSGLVAATDVGELGSGDVNVEIKLPSQTGWLDAGKLFNVGDFTGADGDGCRTSASGSTLGITFGTNSTAYSFGKIVVRITFRNTNKVITGLSVNW